MSALTKNFGSAFQALSQRSGPRRPQRLSYAPLRQLPKSSCFPEALITKARQCEFPFSAIDTGETLNQIISLKRYQTARKRRAIHDENFRKLLHGRGPQEG